MQTLAYGRSLPDDPRWGWEPPDSLEDETADDIQDELLKDAETFREVLDDVYVSAEREGRFTDALYQLFARWNVGGFISHNDADNHRVTIDWDVLMKLNGFMRHIEQALARVAAERAARRT